MGNFVTMPKLGMTMTDGKIMKWLKNEGDKIEKGDYIFEVETDKTSLEVDCLYDGVLLKKYYDEGETVVCNEPMAYIGEAGEAIPEIEKVAPPTPTADAPAQSAAVATVPASSSPKKEKKTAAPLFADDTTKYDYDLIIVGAGPGGYVAALRAAQLGAKVCVVEKDTVGGTCLNRGCIPTKSLYASANQWRKIKEADSFGFKVEKATFDYAKIIDLKNGTVKQLTGGVSALLKKAKVDVKKAVGKVVAEHKVEVDGKTLTAKFIILATGATPASVLKNLPKDVEIYDTDKILDLKKLPKSMVIIGGGVIGCEMACILNNFGVKVTIIELMPTILPMIDEELSACLADHMKKGGITILNGVTADKIAKDGKGYKLTLSDGKEIATDLILEAVGRKTVTDGFEGLGVNISPKGFVEVDEFCATNLPSVFAIGDINGKWQLAHAASEQGITAVERMFGGLTEVEEQPVPSCIFTDLEISVIGMTEKEAKEQGIPVRVFKFPYAANGKALCLREKEGFAKVVADERFGEILGVHIIGAESSVMIHEAVAAMRGELTAEAAGTAIHAHPTLSEVLAEAFLGASKGALHI